MQIEVGTHDALKLYKTILGVTPKALNTVDVIPAIRPLHKLVRAVIHPIMAAIPPVNQTVIRGKGTAAKAPGTFARKDVPPKRTCS